MTIKSKDEASKNEEEIYFIVLKIIEKDQKKI